MVVLQMISILAAVTCGWFSLWLLLVALNGEKDSFRFHWKIKDESGQYVQLSRWGLFMLAAVLFQAACAFFMKYMGG